MGSIKNIPHFIILGHSNFRRNMNLSPGLQLGIHFFVALLGFFVTAPNVFLIIKFISTLNNLSKDI
jgi:hypothetical protein